MKESIFKVDLDGLSNDFKFTEINIASMWILEESQKLVPVETGRLLGSGFIEKNKNYSIVGYETPYAVYVHEIKNNLHILGQAKYLEDAVIAYINKSNSNLSFKLVLDKDGVYVYISDISYGSKLKGLELNQNNILKNSFSSLMDSFSVRGEYND